MKKVLGILIVFLSALGFYIVANSALATSGACSSHGGVNCNAGSSWNGSVKCNDGWEESSVLYSYINECRNSGVYEMNKTCWDYMLGRDEAVRGIDGMLDDTKGKLAKTSDPQAAGKLVNYMQYLGILRKSQMQSYSAYVASCISDLQDKALKETEKLKNDVQDKMNKQCEVLYGHYTFYSPYEKNCLCNYSMYNNRCLTPEEKFALDAKINQNIPTQVAPAKTNDQICNDKYGESSYWTKQIDEDGEPICACIAGYEPSEEMIGCQLKPPTVVVSTSTSDNPEFTKKQLGKIFLQVQLHGEAWYVNPDSGRRYYMKDGATAYQMMRNFGLGITNSNLSKIQSVDDSDEYNESANRCSPGSFENTVKGKILLQVQAHGEAWYVDTEKCLRIYLKDGDAAYTVMRFLGIGITDVDLAKLNIGQ